MRTQEKLTGRSKYGWQMNSAEVNKIKETEQVNETETGKQYRKDRSSSTRLKLRYNIGETRLFSQSRVEKREQRDTVV